MLSQKVFFLENVVTRSTNLLYSLSSGSLMAKKPFWSRHSHKKRNKNNILPVLRNVFQIVSLKNFIFISFHRRRCHNAMETFIQEYLVENSSVDFYRPIKKIKLKTFSYMTKVAKVHVKDWILPIKAQSELF